VVLASACGDDDEPRRQGNPWGDASVAPPDAGLGMHGDGRALGVKTQITCPVLGKDAHNPAALQPSLRIYGTDMGISVVLGERMYLIFGDTWTQPLCDGTEEPYASLESDDLLGSLPLRPEPDPDACLDIEFPTLADDATKFQPITLEHQDAPVELLALGVASAGFAYHGDLYAMFSPYHDVKCTRDSDCEAPSICLIGVCLYRQLPVFPTRILGKSAAAEGRPTGAFTGFAELPDVNFGSLTVHTVNALGASAKDSDYANDAPSDLLVFGRFNYFAGLDGTGLATPPDLYMFRQPLAPLIADERFTPQYFAGLDEDGAPTWSNDAMKAKPIVDGQSEVAANDGQPTPVPILFTGNLSVATIPPFGPEGYRWIAAYGGRSPVGVDAYSTDTDPRLGLFFRLARDPWGPWTPPRRLWSAYDEDGPSVVYRPDWDGVASDEGRNPRSCDTEHPFEDIGVEYSPEIIERFSKVDGDRLTVHWFMSVWNPYRVIQMKSEITLE
jgi:hypothetical protein